MVVIYEGKPLPKEAPHFQCSLMSAMVIVLHTYGVAIINEMNEVYVQFILLP